MLLVLQHGANLGRLVRAERQASDIQEMLARGTPDDCSVGAVGFRRVPGAGGAVPLHQRHPRAQSYLAMFATRQQPWLGMLSDVMTGVFSVGRGVCNRGFQVVAKHQLPKPSSKCVRYQTPLTFA
jgi:hypothetical protein